MREFFGFSTRFGVPLELRGVDTAEQPLDVTIRLSHPYKIQLVVATGMNGASPSSPPLLHLPPLLWYSRYCQWQQRSSSSEECQRRLAVAAAVTL